jgi:preprotein translocase subunit YajC
VGNSYMLIIYIVVFIAIFYFMAIRPQQRQRRAHQELLAALKKGDRISTAAGIYGTVKKIEDNVVHVEIAKGVTMKIARAAVTGILNKDTSEGRAAVPEGSSRKGKGAVAEIEEDASEDAADSEVEADTTENTEGNDTDYWKVER